MECRSLTWQQKTHKISEIGQKAILVIDILDRMDLKNPMKYDP
jgi:hypothetical protein